MAFWDDMDQLLKDLMIEFGRRVKLRRVITPAIFDPVTGGMTGEKTNDQNVQMAFPPTVPGVGGAVERFVSGTIIADSSLVAVLSTQGVSVFPTTDMTVVDGNNIYKINGIVELKPGPKTIGWYLGLKE